MERAVLLVDDDEVLLAATVRMLHEQPFMVYTARNGEEAMRVLKTRNIDVVVSDERMPGMSGVELLTWVAANCPDAIRIVLTGHVEADTAVRAINDAGVYRFFRKPCNEARLAVAIREALERKEVIEEGRRLLESNQQRLSELKQLGQDVSSQARNTAQDLQRPIERILDYCGRLEEQAGKEMDNDSHDLLTEARKAAAEARRLVQQLKAAVEARTR
jgi:DNA-binding NtrC family response regulator